VVKTSAGCVWRPRVNDIDQLSKDNRTFVTNTHNKTPCDILNGRTPRLDFISPFGYPVTILNTLDPLGKFKGKADEGILVGYSITSKAFMEVSDQHYIVLLLWSSSSSTFKSSDDKATDDKPTDNTGSNNIEEPVNKEDQAYRDELDMLMSQEKEASDAADALRPDVGAEADFNNMDSSTIGSPIPTHRVYLDHPKEEILGDPKSTVQTMGMTKKCSGAHALIETKKVSQSLNEASWVEAMQEELLQFSLQKVWRLVDLPYGKKAIRTKWVYRNKKDERAFASCMRFIVYQMDIKSAFLYGKIEEEVYVCQPPSFLDPQFLNKVYKVEKALYGLHQAPKAWYETLCTFRLQNRYRNETIDNTLFIKKDKDDIMLISSIGEHTLCLGLQVKKTSAPIETQKQLVKDDEAAAVDVHLYRSMIGTLMYFTASRPDIMFEVCACSRFQDTPKFTHLHAMKRIFSDYAGENLDRKSTTGACQFFGFVD
nr:hypothetical protein [Tanacetum cinerariifolium]